MSMGSTVSFSMSCLIFPQTELGLFKIYQEKGCNIENLLHKHV